MGTAFANPFTVVGVALRLGPQFVTANFSIAVAGKTVGSIVIYIAGMQRNL
jgi:hypothetical protein